MNKNLPAKAGKFDIALIGNISPEFREEMESFGSASFDRVKIPAGGGLAFEIPGDDPERPESVTEIVGVIVDHHLINAFWQDKYSGGNAPPDCSSMDGKLGSGNPGGSCKSCPLNQFGSGEGGAGKACQNKHRLYILRSGEFLPLLLSVPATSLRNLDDYAVKRVMAKGRTLHQVITRITLKKDKNSTGIVYSQAQFALAGVLDAESAEALAEYSSAIKAKTRRIAVTADTDKSAEEEQPY